MNIKLERFAKQMDIELENNAHKNEIPSKDGIFNWKGLEEKLLDFEYHKAKLLIAIKEENYFSIKEYIADCANVLMAIGDEYGLYDNDCKNDGLESRMSRSIQVLKIDPTKRTNFLKQ